MKLLSWNIQWARGVDGVVDARRIVEHARALADFDVLCLQEVAAGFDELPGAPQGDQFATFAALLPGFAAVASAGVDLDGPHGRRRFGNLLLTRLPLLRVLHHQLPWPADAAAKSMPRTATEATLQTPFGAVAVLNLHLEHFSLAQRAAQVEALRALHAQRCARAAALAAGGARGTPREPYHAPAEATRTLVAGDFNLDGPDDPLHARLLQPFDADGVPRLVDAWQHLNPGRPNPPNAGLYDRSYFKTPFASDFILASEDLLPHLRRFVVDGQTQASDHQPQLLELAG